MRRVLVCFLGIGLSAAATLGQEAANREPLPVFLIGSSVGLSLHCGGPAELARIIQQTVPELVSHPRPASRPLKPDSKSEQPESPQIEVWTRKPEDRAEIAARNRAVVVTLLSPSGIGAATIRRAGGQWPHAVVVRLRLKGLESLRISNGKTTLAASVSSHGDRRGRLDLLEAGKEKPLPQDSRLQLHIRRVQPEGKQVQTPAADRTYFEFAIPKALLQPATEAVQLEWIDFFRG